MNCKRLNVKLIQNLKGTIIATKDFCVKILTKCNESKPNYIEKKATYQKFKHGVYYCIQYRPVWVLERILLRGRWNDKGIWTPDGKFKD